MGIEQKKTAVVFDPHPDDADWWTGGMTLMLIEKGWEVHYICIGTADEQVFEYSDNSAKILGVKRHWLKIFQFVNPMLYLQY